MAVLYVPKASAWKNEKYTASAEGIVSSSPSADDLACVIPVAALEEGTRIIFPINSYGFTGSVFLADKDGRGIAVVSGAGVTDDAADIPLPAGFTESYTDAIVMISATDGNASSLGTYAAAVQIRITDMYFRRSELQQWVSAIQLDEFEQMYPDIVATSYDTALANVYAQIGNYYDIRDLLAITDEEEKDQTLRWILKVFTAYNVCAPSVQISEPLRANFEQANITLKELKGGQVSMIDSASKLQEDGTKSYLVSTNNKYRG